MPINTPDDEDAVSFYLVSRSPDWIRPIECKFSISTEDLSLAEWRIMATSGSACSFGGGGFVSYEHLSLFVRRLAEMFDGSSTFAELTDTDRYGHLVIHPHQPGDFTCTLTMHYAQPEGDMNREESTFEVRVDGYHLDAETIQRLRRYCAEALAYGT